MQIKYGVRIHPSGTVKNECTSNIMFATLIILGTAAPYVLTLKHVLTTT
jgi:hypothetical protein